MEAQQIQEELDRALVLPPQLTGISATLPTPAASMCLKWAPDGKSIVNSALDPDVGATAAATSASQASTSASQASTSASNAATSATNAGNSATNAGNSASLAATSANNAQAAASSIGFKNVKFLTYANSPYAVQATDTGYLISVDTSGGNVVLDLPAISGLVLPVSYGFKKSTSDANTLTINAGGTDTFDNGLTSKAIASGGAGTTLTPEIATTPDKWVTSDWGTLAGQSKYQQFTSGTGFTGGTTTTLTLTNAPLPGSATDVKLYFDGTFQQHSEWSYNPTSGVITFTSAIPTGTSKVEADWSTPLVVGTPADGTVTGAKIATGDKAAIQSAVGLVPGTADGDVVTVQTGGKLPALDGSQLTGIVAVPAGTIIDFAGTSAPSGFLACPLVATNISRTTYAALFAAIGTTWGAGDGSTTFGMPYFPADYVGRQSTNGGADVGTSDAGSVISHSHTTSTGPNISQHASSTSGGINAAAGLVNSTTTSNTGSTGGSANLAAGVRILKCVKY
jgi:hypothetical protein